LGQTKMTFQRTPEFTGKITVDGVAKGTGFVVSAEFGLVVTAHHVIRSADASKLGFQLFDLERVLPVKRVVGKVPIDQEDVALLELEGPLPSGLEVPEIISYVKPTSEFTIKGYDETGKLRSRATTGKLADFVTKSDGAGFYLVEANHAFKGMSGSPVVIPNKGIIGVLIEIGKDKSSFSGQALVAPIDHICELDDRIETLRTKYLKELIQDLHKPSIPFLEWHEYIPLDIEIWRDANLSPSELPTFDDDVEKATASLTKFVVLGQPGSGKTSTLRKIAITAAQDCLTNFEAPLPIYIDLWKWSEGSSFNSFIATWIKSHLIYNLLLRIADYDELLLSQNICFYLDGLDELQNTTNIRHLKEWLESYSNRAVISCRSEEFTNIRHLNLPVILLRPLSRQKVTEFVRKYLDEASTSQFLSKILPKAWDVQAETGYLRKLVELPLLLLLLLDEFKKTKDISSLSSPWQLFQQITERLWMSDRVQARLDSPDLKKYQTISEITKALAQVGYECIESQTIPRETALVSLKSDSLLDAVSEAGLLRVDILTGQVRFLHPLFAEYFAAHTLENKDGEVVYAKQRSSKWAGVFVFLAGKDEALRQKLQMMLTMSVMAEEYLHSGKDLSHLSYSGGMLWILGQIGDEHTIMFLLDYIHDQIKRDAPPLTTAFATVGSIAGRLEEGNPAKVAALDWFEAILNADYEINLFAGEYTHVIKVLFRVIAAVADVSNEHAASILLNALETISLKTATEFDRNTLVSFIVLSLSRINSGVKILLAAGQNKNPIVVNAAYQALQMMDWNEPPQGVVNNLEMHPSPTVRNRSAFLLGKTKDSKSTTALINALDDKGIWGYGKNTPVLGLKTRHFYVADTAAYALAQIGTDKNILLSKGYESDGSISIPLLMKRIKGRTGDRYFTEWWATLVLTAPTPDNLWKLFGCMGYSGVGFNLLDMPEANYFGVGFQQNDPILTALCEFDNYPTFRSVAEYYFQLDQTDRFVFHGSTLKGDMQSYVDSYLVNLMPDSISRTHDPVSRSSKRESIQNILIDAEAGVNRELFGNHLNDAQLLHQLRESIRILDDLDAQAGRRKETITAQLREYVTEGSDLVSRRWALVALGRLGNTDDIALLTDFLSDNNKFPLHSAAFYSLGILAARHSKTQLPIEELIDIFLNRLSTIDIEAWSGFGIGIAQIVIEYQKENPELTNHIVQRLIEEVKSGDGSAARIALDALECIYFGLADYSEVGVQNPSSPTEYLPLPLADELVEIVSTSPSYWMKVGNHLLTQSRDDDRPDLDIIEVFQKVLFFKHNLRPDWAITFSESDWLNLCCDDELAFYQIAEILFENHQLGEAYKLFAEVVEDIKKKLRLSDSDKRLQLVCLMATVYLCDLSLKLPIDMQTRLRHIMFAYQLASITGEKQLLLQIHLISQQVFIQIGTYGDVLRECEDAILIAEEIDKPDEMGISLLNMARVFEETGKLQEALHHLDLAESKIKKHTEASQWVSLKLRQIVLRRQLGTILEENEASIIDTAKTIYELRSDWAGISDVLQDVTRYLYNDTDPVKALETYEEALTYLERAKILKRPDQKALLLYDMALLCEVHLKDFDKARQNYIQAIEILEQLDMLEPLSTVMVSFGHFLAQQGERKAGVDLVLNGLAIQQQLKLPVEYTLDVLTQIGDPDNKWNISAAEVYMFVRTAVHVLTQAADLLQEWLLESERLLAMMRANEWQTEVEFIEAVKEIVVSKQSSPSPINFGINRLPSSHPYFSQVQEIIDLIRQYKADETMQELFSLMEKAIDIVINSPEEREEFGQQISLMGLQSMLQGKLSFGALLMGIREYLRGKTPENADAALDENALQLLKILVDRTEEMRAQQQENDSD